MPAWHEIAHAVQCGQMGVKSRRIIRAEKHDAGPWASEKRYLTPFSPVELLTKDLSDMKVRVNHIAEGTARLLHVAEIREERISRPEDAKS